MQTFAFAKTFLTCTSQYKQMRQAFPPDEYIQTQVFEATPMTYETAFQRYEMNIYFVPRLPINMLTCSMKSRVKQMRARASASAIGFREVMSKTSICREVCDFERNHFFNLYRDILHCTPCCCLGRLINCNMSLRQRHVYGGQAEFSTIWRLELDP
jgi:hypothetical protein